MSENLQNNHNLAENSEIASDNNITINYVKILGIVFVALIVLFATLKTIFFSSSNEKPLDKKSDIVNKFDTLDKNFIAGEKFTADESYETLQSQAVTPSATSLFDKEEKRVEYKVYKTSSLLVDTASNSGGMSSASGNDSRFGGLDMNDPCVVLDPKTNKFTKLDIDTCANRLATGNTSKVLDNNGELGYSSDIYEQGAYRPTAAKKHNFDENMLLPEGTFIPCSLNTKVVSQISGQISCTISKNIYSANGKVLLIEQGSKLSGQFKSDEMNDGMNRIFVIWTKVRTPNSIDIHLLSGATDNLGGSGLEGWVDHHYLTRFGSAIMISVIDDALGAVVDRYIRKGNDNGGYYDSDITSATRETAREMAREILSQFSNIKPTLYRNHGDLVGVYVNRDIDFSNVYALEWKNE